MMFSSDRERRLWTWVFVVVMTIYSTLGLAAKLVGHVDGGLLAVAFATCLVFVGVAILTQGLRVRPGGIEIGVAIGVATVYVLLGVRMAIPERSHLMEYGVLAVLVYEAISERVSQGHCVRISSVYAFLLTSLFGFLDECIQAVLPSRVFDWRDVMFNTLAALTAIAGMVALRCAQGYARRWSQTSRQKTPTQIEDRETDRTEP